MAAARPAAHFRASQAPPPPGGGRQVSGGSREPPPRRRPRLPAGVAAGLALRGSLAAPLAPALPEGRATSCGAAGGGAWRGPSRPALPAQGLCRPKCRRWPPWQPPLPLLEGLSAAGPRSARLEEVTLSCWWKRFPQPRHPYPEGGSGPAAALCSGWRESPGSWHVSLWLVLGLPHGLMFLRMEVPVKGIGVGIRQGLALQHGYAKVRPQEWEL